MVQRNLLEPRPAHRYKLACYSSTSTALCHAHPPTASLAVHSAPRDRFHHGLARVAQLPEEELSLTPGTVSLAHSNRCLFYDGTFSI